MRNAQQNRERHSIRAARIPRELVRVVQGGPAAGKEGLSELLPQVYGELRRLASTLLSGERNDHTLQATALVHEAYLRLARSTPEVAGDRGTFLKLAAAVMRHILINHARDRNRDKRVGHRRRVLLDRCLEAFEERAVDVIALDEALTRLRAMDPRQSHVVELRFFGGLTMPEIAQVLGVSKRTVDSDWQMARAWLLREVVES
jgi:RNA polymerase sigma factor (TIGR02999 family)